MKRRVLLLTLLLSSMATTVPLLADTKTEHQATLSRLISDVDTHRQALRELDKSERSVLTLIGDLDRSTTALERVAKDNAKKRDQLALDVERIDTELARDEKQFVDVKQRLSRRLRGLYVLGEGGAIRHLLGAESFEDLAYRRKLLARLAESDALLINDHKRIFDAVKSRRDEKAVALATVDEIGVQLIAQKESLKNARNERAAAMTKIDAQKDLLVKQIKELIVEQLEVKKLIDKLARERPSRPLPTGKGLLKRGALLWPVDGTISRAYGTVREAGTGARITSNGCHIAARLGAPVQAPAEGRVAHKGWLRGYGQMVIVDHGDGVHTLYAHLQRDIVEKGDVVQRGQTIGFVGDTESFDGPELYFEVRKDGRPRDPAPYLAK